VEFEWDPTKAEANLRKHGISFARATFAFNDPSRIEYLDPEDDHGEERWITVGFVHPYLLLVVFTMRNHKIRLISARKATRNEQRRYTDGDIPSRP
jgi:uncharacterized DUF497 family protein